MHVDGFGNVITNITPAELSNAETVQVKLHHVSLPLALTEAYGQVNPQQATALIGSHGFLELALNKASFAEKHRVNPGDKVEVTPT